MFFDINIIFITSCHIFLFPFFLIIFYLLWFFDHIDHLSSIFFITLFTLQEYISRQLTFIDLSLMFLSIYIITIQIIFTIIDTLLTSLFEYFHIFFYSYAFSVHMIEIMIVIYFFRQIMLTMIENICLMFELLLCYLIDY